MFSNLLKHKLIDKNIKAVELAELINTSKQNLSHKMKRDNFSEKEMVEIAKALNCDLEINIIDRETGKKL